MLKRVSLALIFVVLALAGFALPAATAATGDEIKNFTIGYSVSADGVLHVKETIAYHFGDSGRHGIFRDLVVREPYKDDDSLDQKYEVSNIAVQSDDASDQFTTETTKTNGDRDETLRIKIGSETQTVPGYDATYVITYDVRGALRHFADHSELYWDATGSAWDAVIDQVTVNVAVPQGVQQVQCFTGLAGSTQACAQKSVAAGKAGFGASQLLRGSQLTIVAGIKAGAVQNDTPILATPPNWLERNGLSWVAVAASSVLTVIALVFGAIYRRMAGRDQRYAGMPPGTVPPEGARAPVEKDDLAEDQLPVAFSPPKIPVAEGGVLIDSKATTTEVAATLIDLAVRGAVRIDNTRGIAQKVILVDPAVATARHEEMLLHGLFPSTKPGAERLLLPSADNTMAQAADATIDAAWDQVRAQRWYSRLPRQGTRSDKYTGFGWLATLVIVGLGIGATQLGSGSLSFGRILLIAVPAIALLFVVQTWMAKMRLGRRTAAGRAVTDQVIGFRTYLTTAEADQLRFEEGEDIFSKYLPWATVFGIAERWQKICEELVHAGRLTADPAWYDGPSYYSSGWSSSGFSSTVASTFVPPPASSSGSGGGSSSGFSVSSGSSGGGGGGGGGGSW
jgi:uncharacterized membrane protein YgcG